MGSKIVTAMHIDEKYLWTRHAHEKMRFYRLTESRIKRIIRHPTRLEEGILEGAVACMQVAEGKNYSEIWTMYVLTANRGPQLARHKDKQIKIITAWRYPGKSPERDPVPPEVLREVRKIL